GIELGCSFSINPDAHSNDEIASSTRWGLAIARKSGMRADRVINTLDRDSFARWLLARKERATPRLARTRKRKPQTAYAALRRLVLFGVAVFRLALLRFSALAAVSTSALCRSASIKSEGLVGSGALGGVILRPSILALTSSTSAAS